MAEKELTGYPSIDKPWLKYYSEEAINAPLPECTIYEYLWENNKDHLDDVALIYFGRRITYRKMFLCIDQTAAAFAALGVKHGDTVVVALPNIPENVFCVYGLNKLGAVADMVDLRSKGDVLIHYLNEANAKLAVICDMFAENVFKVIKETKIETLVVSSPYDSLPVPLRIVAKITKEKPNLPKFSVVWKQFICKEFVNGIEVQGISDDVACIFHTSGTTGLPKGVMMTNRNFNAMVLHYRNGNMKFSAKDVFLNQVPPFLAYNIILSTHLPLSLHMTIQMLPKYQPEAFVENIIRYKPNHVMAGPADWGNFINNPKAFNHDFSFLRAMASGSDSLSTESKKRVNKILSNGGCKYSILEGYGLTEIGSAAITCWPNCNIENSVGIPHYMNNVCIYDAEADRELPYNEVGEICLSGPTLMKSYYNDPEATAKALRKHADGITWLHSGDLGYISESGNVYLIGRMKRVIVCHDGIKISPFSLEKVIMKHPDISACCVVGASDKIHGMGQIPVAYIVLRNTDRAVIDEIENLCRLELSENYWPQKYRVLDTLPLTPNGKVDYRALEKLAEQDPL